MRFSPKRGKQTLPQTLWQILPAFVAGSSTTLAFAPYNFWFIYPLALAFALWQMPTDTLKNTMRYWWSFGFGMFAVGISWVHVSIAEYGGMPLPVTLVLMAGLAFYLALYPALVGLCWRIFCQPPKRMSGMFKKLQGIENPTFQYLWLFPALWVLGEWLRGWFLTGFPWLWAGYSQTEGPLQGLAPYIGTLGLSFVIAMFGGALRLLLSGKFIPLAALCSLFVISPLLSTYLPQIEATDEKIKVALVQGNIAQSLKWEPENLWPTLQKYTELSLPSIDQAQFDADIVIWPEAAIPAPEFLVYNFLESLDNSFNNHNSALISGIITGEETTGYHNSLMVFGNQHHFDQAQGNYQQLAGNNQFHKHQLLPIGEFVPFESLLRPLAPLFNLPMSSFADGDFQQPNLEARGYKFAPAICYEIAFPAQVRANVYQDTDVLLTVSNDTWFGTSDGPLQHMQIAQMRALELGRPLIRVTNNGVTAIVNYDGQMLAQAPQFEEAVINYELPLVAGETWYKRLGQWPVLILSWLILGLGTVLRVFK